MIALLTFALGIALGVWATIRARGKVMLEMAVGLGEAEAARAAAQNDLAHALGDLARAQRELENLVPALEDSPAWSATTPTFLRGGAPLEDKVGEALAKVLTYGGKLRECRFCSDPATDSKAVEYEWAGDRTRVLIHERCQSCLKRTEFRVGIIAWTCMEAMRVWEGGRTATSLFESEVQRTRDLEDLDI